MRSRRTWRYAAVGPELPLERVAVGKNALSDVLALAAVREIGANLERAVADGDDMEARAGMLFGSLNAGLAFANPACRSRTRCSSPSAPLPERRTGWARG